MFLNPSKTLLNYGITFFLIIQGTNLRTFERFNSFMKNKSAGRWDTDYES